MGRAQLTSRLGLVRSLLSAARLKQEFHTHREMVLANMRRQVRQTADGQPEKGSGRGRV